MLASPLCDKVLSLLQALVLAQAPEQHALSYWLDACWQCSVLDNLLQASGGGCKATNVGHVLQYHSTSDGLTRDQRSTSQSNLPDEAQQMMVDAMCEG